MGANRGRRPGGKDFSPRIRSMFDIALKEALEKGTLLKKLKEQLEEDPVGTMAKMAPYAPKQITADITTRDETQVDTNQLTEEVYGQLIDAARNKPEVSELH